MCISKHTYIYTVVQTFSAYWVQHTLISYLSAIWYYGGDEDSIRYINVPVALVSIEYKVCAKLILFSSSLVSIPYVLANSLNLFVSCARIWANIIEIAYYWYIKYIWFYLTSSIVKSLQKLNHVLIIRDKLLLRK